MLSSKNANFCRTNKWCRISKKVFLYLGMYSSYVIWRLVMSPIFFDTTYTHYKSHLLVLLHCITKPWKPWEKFVMGSIYIYVISLTIILTKKSKAFVCCCFIFSGDSLHLHLHCFVSMTIWLMSLLIERNDSAEPCNIRYVQQ